MKESSADNRIMQMIVSLGKYREYKEDFMGQEDATTSYCVFTSIDRISDISLMYQRRFTKDISEFLDRQGISYGISPQELVNKYFREYIAFNLRSEVYYKGIYKPEDNEELVDRLDVYLLENDWLLPDKFFINNKTKLNQYRYDQLILNAGVYVDEGNAFTLFKFLSIQGFDWLNIIKIIANIYFVDYYCRVLEETVFTEVVECGMIMFLLKQNKLIENALILKPLKL